MIDIQILDDELTLVATATVDCGMTEPDLPTGSRVEACNYSVTSYADEIRDDLAVMAGDATRTMNSAAGARGIYGADDIRNRRAEMGQDTVQVLNGSASVQLTVTSCEEGPAYIRFTDTAGVPFGTDVDECESCPNAEGANVVGLNSGQMLDMNLMTIMSAADALMYDQYDLVEMAVGVNSWVQYLDGNQGAYYQGKFRVFDPCAVGDFYVEVYEKENKAIRMLQNGMYRELVTCVPSAIADPTEFSVTVHTAGVTVVNGQTFGRATVRWAEIAGSVTYHVAALDTTNPAMWTVAGYEVVDDEDTRAVIFTGLMSGTTYLFVTIGELANGTYSEPRALLQTTVYQ
jgi:hypothetical protein